MNIIGSIKYRILHQSALFIGFCVRHYQSFAFRNFVANRIFRPYFGWRKLELETRTAFGARMLLSLPDSIQTRIFLTGIWEPPITNIISKSLGKGDIFIDVGANVGYYTLLASKLVGDAGRVYSFEASPAVFGRLQNNISANDMQNVEIFNIAVSNEPGKVTIWAAPNDNIGHSTIISSVAEKDGHHREAEVRCDVLGAFVPLPYLLAARFIKIDIEGAERLAIEGIFPHLIYFAEQTEWLVELSPEFSPRGQSDIDWVFKTFIDAGYSAYLIENTYPDFFIEISEVDYSHFVPMFEPPTERLNDLLFSKVRERR